MLFFGLIGMMMMINCIQATNHNTMDDGESDEMEIPLSRRDEQLKSYQNHKGAALSFQKREFGNCPLSIVKRK